MENVDSELSENRLIDFITEERAKALSFVKKIFSMEDDDAEDVVQESSIALFKNIKQGKLINLTSTLSTYFLSICKRQALKHKDKKSRIISFDDKVENTQKDEYSESKIDEILNFGESSITNEQKSFMHQIVQDLPKPCEDILWYYYGDDLDMQTIADLLEYKNADTVKSTKSRCMSKLKERFSKMKEDFYD